MKNSFPQEISANKLTEVIKIMPVMTLALFLTLSGCKEDDTLNTAKAYGIGEKEIVNDSISRIHHPDYYIEENSANYNADTLGFPDKDLSIERSVVVKPNGEIYIRMDDSTHHVYVGSQTVADSLESDMGQGTISIKGYKDK